MSLFYFDFSKESETQYQPTQLMEFMQGVYDPTTSYFMRELGNMLSDGTYTILTVPQRPDVYSRDIYGTVDFWFFLLYYNNITFLEELDLGKTLEYPSLADMEDIFFTLKIRSVG